MVVAVDGDLGVTWCTGKAGLRIHGTTCAQPAVVFAEDEAAVLLPAPEVTYQVPIYVARACASARSTNSALRTRDKII